jgi:hypothetical protein
VRRQWRANQTSGRSSIPPSRRKFRASDRQDALPVGGRRVRRGQAAPEFFAGGGAISKQTLRGQGLAISYARPRFRPISLYIPWTATAVAFVFLYAPIFVMVAMSFNAGQ